MEQLNFAGKYSFKNITIPEKLEYTKQLVYSIEQLLRRMRWRAFYYLKLGENKNNSDDGKSDIDDENIDSEFALLFRSGAKPPFIREMEKFEKELLEIPKKLEFRKYSNTFQRKMKENLQTMKKSTADKTF